MSTQTDVANIPMPITAGEEMAALERFHRDVTWSGTIEPGGMGPGTPPMTAVGEGRHHTIQDGRWIVGWDPVVGEYTATYADNYGRAGVMDGRIDGDRLVFESPKDALVRIRLTWDCGPDRLVWRNEVSAHGEPWRLVEEYVCRPL